MKSHITALVFLLLVPVAAEAFDDGRRVERIGLLIDPARSRHERMVQNHLARELERSLQSAGFEVRRVGESIEALQDVDTRADAYVEISDLWTDSSEYGGFGSGTRIGSVGVGGEVAIVASSVRAHIRILEGETLDVIESFELDAFAGGPALTSIGLGDRHGYGFLRVPLFSRGKEKIAARELGRKCASRVRALISDAR